MKLMLSRRVAGLTAALALSGCSYLQMDRPPKAVRRGDVFPGCTTQNTYPYLDLALTAFAVIGAVLEGGLFALSTRYGFEQSARCRELRTGTSSRARRRAAGECAPLCCR